MPVRLINTKTRLPADKMLEEELMSVRAPKLKDALWHFYIPSWPGDAPIDIFLVIDSTDKDHKTNDRNVCHAELKVAFAIIKKHHVLYQSAERRIPVYLAAQRELIESGYVNFAKH